MPITKCNINTISPFVRFVGQSNFFSGAVTKKRCNADHRLFYIKRGALTLYANKCEYSLTTGDAILLLAGVPYKIVFEQDTTLIPVNFVFVTTGNESIPPRSLPMYEPKKFKKETIVETPEFEDGFLKDKILIQKSVLELGQLLDKMIIEFKRMEPLYIKILSQYLNICLCIMHRHTEFGQSSVNNRHTDILDYISKYFASPLTNKSIAEIFHYHPNYVNQIIKEKTGISLHQYLIRLRLLHAADLLLYTEIPINEIATLCGFSDAGYFSYYFKKCYGCSPTVFKGEKSK